MGVDLFFVLSGYLIGWQVLREYARGGTPDWRRFMLSRAFRILPAYYAVLALYILLPGWREGRALQPAWKFITFTLNLSPDWERGTAYSHAWSLCVEEHFYLLFPLVAWLLARTSGIPRGTLVGALAVGIVAAGMALRGWLWHHQVAPLFDTGDTAMAMRRFVAAIYNPTWARLDGLLAGVMLAAVRAFRPAWWSRLMRHGWLLLLLGATIVVGSTRVQAMSAPGAVFLFPLVALGGACLLAGAASPRTWPGRWKLPGAQTLATLAFSLYLTHKGVYGWLDAALPGLGRQAPVLALAIYAGASVAAAAVLYLAVERPGLRLRERWLRGGIAPPGHAARPRAAQWPATASAPCPPVAGSPRPAPADRPTATDESP